MAQHARIAHIDGTAGSWAPSSGANLWSCIQTPDDGQYITGTGSSACRLAIVPVRLPRNCTVNFVRLTVRARCADTSSTSTLRAYVRRSNTNYAHTGGYLTVSGTSWQAFTFDWTTNPYTGLDWKVTDTDYDEFGYMAGFELGDFDPAVDVDYFEMVVDYTMDVADGTTISVSQVTTGIRPVSNSDTMTPVNVTIGAGDVVVIMEAYGRAITWTPTWSVDSSPISPTISHDIGDTQVVRGFAISGLSAGSHTIESVNPASGGSSIHRIIYSVMVVSGATTTISSGDFHPFISNSSNREVAWEDVAIPGNGMAVGLFLSRNGNAPAGLSHIQVGSGVDNGGTTVTYGSAVCQIYSPATAVTDTFAASWMAISGTARLGLVLSPASAGGPVVNKLRIGGVTPSSIQYGSTAVDKIYVGDQLIYGKEPDG